MTETLSRDRVQDMPGGEPESVTDVTSSLLNRVREGSQTIPDEGEYRGPDTDGNGGPTSSPGLPSLTSEQMQEEVKLLSQSPNNCWSIEAARWVSGHREGLTFAGVLAAERGRRVGFNREVVLTKLKEDMLLLEDRSL